MWSPGGGGGVYLHVNLCLVDDGEEVGRERR